MIKKQLLAMALLLLTGFTFGQAITLKGKLTDKTDNTAIVGATVKLVNQSSQADARLVVTDKTGSFAFNNLPAANYTLTITYSGYEKIEQRINLQASNTKPLAFSIGKVATDLSGVTVVAKAPRCGRKWIPPNSVPASLK